MALAIGQKTVRGRILGLIGTIVVHSAIMLAWFVPADSEPVSADPPLVMLNLVQMGEPVVPVYKPPVPNLPPLPNSIVVPEFPALEVTSEIPEVSVQNVTKVAGTKGGTETYYSLFARHLGRHLEYPARSKLLGEEGGVLVRVLIKRDGTLVSAGIEESSGFEALDEEAVAVVLRAQPFPPPPIVIPGDPITLFMPVEFHVENRRQPKTSAD